MRLRFFFVFHARKTSASSHSSAPFPGSSPIADNRSPINRPFPDGLFLFRSGYAFAPLPHTPAPRAYFCEIRRARRAMGSLTLRAYARRFFCCRQRQSLETSNKTAISPRENANASRKRRADKPPHPRCAFSVVAPAMRSLRSPHTPPPRAYFCEIRRARRAMGSLTLRAYARRFFCCRHCQSLETSNKTAISHRKNASASRKRRADKPPLPRWAFSVAAPAMRSLRSRIRLRRAPISAKYGAPAALWAR